MITNEGTANANASRASERIRRTAAPAAATPPMTMHARSTTR